MIFITLGLLHFLLTACQFGGAPSTTQNPSPIETQPTGATAAFTVTPAASPNPAPEPRQLTICMGQEPATLFWYEAYQPASKSVLAALYDVPFENLNLNNQFSILEKTPVPQDGDVRLEAVAVQPGDWLMDAQGNLTVLTAGVRYRPVGCAATDCALEFSADQAVTVDQVVIRFRLKAGLLWADGEPLTADDSLYSFELARALQPEPWLDLLQVTQSYQAVDELSIEWRGVPGYQGGEYGEKFFVPLPRHAWGSLALDDLRSVASRSPLGWGAYQVESWQAGDRITLTKNPHYFRTAEGLPHFDRLVFRFMPTAAEALQAFRNAECDLLDPTAVSEGLVADYLALQAAGQAQLLLQPAAALEQLTLGISSYDDPTPRVLAQKEVRQALASCIDRAALASQMLGGLAQPAYSFLPPGHPQSINQAPSFDPQSGMQLLQAAGWMDVDNDPATPRTAQSVPGIADGASLAVQYLVSPEPERQQTASMVKAGLEACGFGVQIVTLPFDQYLAPGPDGPVFGRRFDLAQFAWPAAGEDLCALYLSSEIPGPYPQFPKGWGGGNAGGYSSQTFDQACQERLTSLPDSEARRQALQQVQNLLVQDVPVFPLYWRFRLALVRPDMCGLGQGQPAVNPPANQLWNFEQLDRGEACAGK